MFVNQKYAPVALLLSAIRGQRALKQTVTVDIQDSNENSLGSVPDKPPIPCSLYNISRLWWSRAPTGFFYNGKWNLRNCHVIRWLISTEDVQHDCLSKTAASAEIVARPNRNIKNKIWTIKSGKRPCISNKCQEGHVKRAYNIGEEIRAIVTLHDGYGKRKYSGGDHLRATIENRAINASAPCVVTDNNDGTQAVTCEALWSGFSTIYVSLAYTRETITTIYRIRTQVLSTRYIGIKFGDRAYREVTTCHPNHTQLLRLTRYTDVCNLTNINSGMPFYCGKPKDKHLRCQDMQLERTNIPLPQFKFTQCEDILLKRGQQALKQTLDVKVRNKNNDRLVSIIDKPSISCSMYNISLLWQSRRPTGFFFNGKWILRNCRGFSQKFYETCLRNRRLYVFGDSTTRAWYGAILKRFNCQHITEKWTKEKWSRDSECYNDEINFKAGWYPQAQPFIARSLADTSITLYSTSGRIDHIPQHTRAIVVIHIYMHMVAFHHSVFKQRMETIRKSVDRFLTKNKQSIVMIKAPHTYENTPYGTFRLSDYFGYVYSKLLYEVFEGLHERVVLLNNRDTTIGQHVQWNHPPENIINAMIDQMLSYACDS